MNIFLLEKKRLRITGQKKNLNRMIENEEKQFIKVVFLFFFSTCVNYRKNRLQSVVYAFELLMEFNATKSKHFIELFEILYSYCLNRFTTYYTQ